MFRYPCTICITLMVLCLGIQKQSDAGFLCVETVSLSHSALTSIGGVGANELDLENQSPSQENDHNRFLERDAFQTTPSNASSSGSVSTSMQLNYSTPQEVTVARLNLHQTETLLRIFSDSLMAAPELESLLRPPMC